MYRPKLLGGWIRNLIAGFLGIITKSLNCFSGPAVLPIVWYIGKNAVTDTNV